MHSNAHIAAILKSLPSLSPVEKRALKVRLVELLRSDRRYKLGEVQAKLAVHYPCAGCRPLLDEVLMNDADIEEFDLVECDDGRLGDWCSDCEREALCCDPASISERCRYDQSTRCASQKARDLDH